MQIAECEQYRTFYQSGYAICFNIVTPMEFIKLL